MFAFGDVVKIDDPDHVLSNKVLSKSLDGAVGRIVSHDDKSGRYLVELSKEQQTKFSSLANSLHIPPEFLKNWKMEEV